MTFRARLIALSALALAAPACAENPPAPSVTILGAGVEVSALEPALRFYTLGMGFTVVRRIELDGATEMILSTGAEPRTPLLFVMARGKRSVRPARAPRMDKIVMRANDADALAARQRAAGYAPSEVTANPLNHARGFWVKDPDGNAFEVTSTPRPAS